MSSERAPALIENVIRQAPRFLGNVDRNDHWFEANFKASPGFPKRFIDGEIRLLKVLENFVDGEVRLPETKWRLIGEPRLQLKKHMFKASPCFILMTLLRKAISDLLQSKQGPASTEDGNISRQTSVDQLCWKAQTKAHTMAHTMDPYLVCALSTHLPV